MKKRAGDSKLITKFALYSNHQGEMKLTIENLGAIKQMEVDLSKDFIIFCGPNNTGKTYVSYILFSFLTIKSTSPLKCFSQIAKNINEKGQFIIKKEFIEEWLAKTCNDIILQTGSIFGISENTRIKLFDKFKLSAHFSDEDFEKIIRSSIDSTINDGGICLKVTKEKASEIIKIDNVGTNILQLSSSALRTSAILNSLFSGLVFTNNGSARMLTVERNSIYTFKTELSISRNELIDRIQQNNIQSESDLLGIVNSSSRRYPLAVRSSLRIANDLETVQKTESKFSIISEEIERDLLKGEVSMTKNGDVEFHAARMAKTKHLPFHLSSSIVKTMASLVIYLRHIARYGDTLIVDEPEMNFHPDVQVHLSKIFAKLANLGLRIIISTHSDYIIREINNMVMASSLLEAGCDCNLSSVGYDKGCTINKNDLDVVFFNYKPGSKIVSVSHLDIDDDGFEVETIDKTINEQNLKAEWLYNRMAELNEK